MTSHIVVLGAGYAGLIAAKLAARRTGATVTLVNERDRFVERVRNHQLATGQRLRDRPLHDLLKGTGIRLAVDRVTSIDPEQRQIELAGETEPISLNAALQIRDHLRRRNVRSLVVVTSAFRSRRSELIYRAVLGGGGPTVHCDPVFITATPEDWARQWHSIQEVTEEFLKLQYYRFYVIPFLLRAKVAEREQQHG